MAYKGYGAWALIGQYLSNTILNSIILLVTVSWRPHFMFSIKRAKSLAIYGWKILLAAILDEINLELTSLAIGKRYSSGDLAFYTKGKQLPNILNANVSNTITSIMFSVFSREQDDKKLLKAHLKKGVQNTAFIMFPLLLGMGAVSEELIILLLTEKWIAAIPYMRIFCISCLFTPINAMNIQIIKAVGASGKYLKMTGFKTILSIVIVFLALPFGTTYVAIAGIVNAAVATFLQSLPMKKILGYSFREELVDLFPIVSISVVMMLIMLAIGKFDMPLVYSLGIKVIVGLGVYIGLAKILRLECFNESLRLIFYKKR